MYRFQTKISVVTESGLNNMKYVKYGHGRWMPKPDPAFMDPAWAKRAVKQFCKAFVKAMQNIAKHYKI